VKWYGKILCCLIGYRIFGPAGALLGFYLGHLVDRQETYGEMPRQNAGFFRFVRPTHIAERQNIFFTCVFSMLAKLARADGHISADEIEIVETFMRDDLNLDPERQKVAKNIFRSARESNKTFLAYAEDFYRAFHRDPVMLENLLDTLLRLSLADGNLVHAEEVLLKDAARVFGLGSFDFDRLRSRHGSQPDRDYAILGCSPTDSVELIKKKYRKLAKENHPDATKAKGQPEEFAKIASDKFRAIQSAYESIKERRGFT